MQCIRYRCNIGRPVSSVLTGGVKLIAKTIVVILTDSGIFLLLWFNSSVNVLYGYFGLVDS